MTTRRAVRGRLLTFVDDPAQVGADASHRYLADGVVSIEAGSIVAVGAAAELLPTLPVGTPVDHYPDQLVLPGLIDTHIHYPQTQVIASYGAQLLEWLQKYTFVEEQKFADPAHADRVARFFLDELFRNGTTTAVGLLHGAAGIGRGFFRREPSPRRADDRRQGDDGSRRARRPARHGAARL